MKNNLTWIFHYGWFVFCFRAVHTELRAVSRKWNWQRNINFPILTERRWNSIELQQTRTSSKVKLQNCRNFHKCCRLAATHRTPFCFCLVISVWIRLTKNDTNLYGLMLVRTSRNKTLDSHLGKGRGPHDVYHWYMAKICAYYVHSQTEENCV